MGRRSIAFSFPNGRGQTLSGILDAPEDKPLFYGVFAPCFTCTKESHGAAKVCRALAESGAAMLRFDLTGLGASEGDFAATNFSTRILDIVAAARALEEAHEAPRLLVGHSISGTAALSAARRIPSLQAVATIGSPRDPGYVIEKFRRNGQIAQKGDMIEISVMGRPTLFRPGFIEDMTSQSTEKDTAEIGRRLFVFHAPRDAIVSFENARAIAARAGGEAELIPLDDDATHLFENRKDDAVFIAGTLMDWFRTHLK